MYKKELSNKFKWDTEPLKTREITDFFRKIDLCNKKNIFDTVGWNHKKDGSAETEILMSGINPSLEKRLSSLEDNECLILPFSCKCMRHVTGIMFCNSPQKKVYVLDTGGNNKREDKRKEINDFFEKNNLKDYSVDNSSFLFGTIQGKSGCGYNVVNEAEVLKELSFTTDTILQKAQTGELQFLVMSKSSNIMQSRTGNIQIIENLGESVGEGANVVVPETENPEYMEFNLGNSRFKVSLSQNDSITKNSYISRPRLIKSIGDRNVLEAIQQKQDKLPNNLIDAVNDRLQQLRSTVQQQTVNVQNNGLSSLRCFSALSISGISRTAPTTTSPQRRRSFP